MISFCFLTSRKNCKFDWWIQSLTRQIKGRVRNPQVVVIDFWSQPLPWHDWTEKNVEARRRYFEEWCSGCDLVVSPPKPNVYQGQYRLTQSDYFAACNARNTAFMLSRHEFVAMSDDLSVVMPGWLDGVLEAGLGFHVALGAYRKDQRMEVEDGRLIQSEPGSIDSRYDQAKGPVPFPCGGGWFFGCSFAMPIAMALQVNGFDENCGTLSFEDVIFGVRLENAGYKLRYDQRMLTVESEELHAEGPVMKRIDKGMSPKDKSHAILAAAQTSDFAPNYFGPGGLRAARDEVLKTGKLPMLQIPEHDWFDGQLFKDFP